MGLLETVGQVTSIHGETTEVEAWDDRNNGATVIIHWNSIGARSHQNYLTPDAAIALAGVLMQAATTCAQFTVNAAARAAAATVQAEQVTA